MASELPYEILEIIAGYVPIDWAWVSYENDPMYHIGLNEFDYMRIFKYRASKEVMCTCLHRRYIKRIKSNSKERTSIKKCVARTHFCQCAGDISIEAAIRNAEKNKKIDPCGQYICATTYTHYSICKAFIHIIGCHCRYKYNYFDEEITCPLINTENAVHNCICINNIDMYSRSCINMQKSVETVCESVLHTCSCQHICDHYTYYKKLPDDHPMKKCRALTHLCICFYMNNVYDVKCLVHKSMDIHKRTKYMHRFIYITNHEIFMCINIYTNKIVKYGC